MAARVSHEPYGGHNAIESGVPAHRPPRRRDIPNRDQQVRPGELVFNAMAPGEQVYEYACHEGSYGLANVLSGARQQEPEGAQKKPQ